MKRLTSVILILCGLAICAWITWEAKIEVFGQREIGKGKVSIVPAFSDLIGSLRPVSDVSYHFWHRRNRHCTLFVSGTTSPENVRRVATANSFEISDDPKNSIIAHVGSLQKVDRTRIQLDFAQSVWCIRGITKDRRETEVRYSPDTQTFTVFVQSQ